MIWLSVLELLIFTFSGIVILVYGIDVLKMADTTKAGILTLIVPSLSLLRLASANVSQFDFTSLSLRGYTPPGLGVGSGIVSSLQGGASTITSAASIATSEALSIASEAQTIVSSAITAIESDLSSVVPRNCSLGTRYFCLGYVSNVACSELPLNFSGLLSGAVSALSSSQLSSLASSLEPVEQKLEYVSAGLIEAPFVLGLILMGMLIAVLIIAAVRFLFWKKESSFEYRFRSLPLEMIFGIVAILICLISFVYLPITLRIVFTKAEHLPFKVEKGELMNNSLVILSCTIAMAFCVASTCFRKYTLLKRR